MILMVFIKHLYFHLRRLCFTWLLVNHVERLSSVNFGQFYVHLNVQLFSKEFVFLHIPHSRNSFKGVYYAE